MNKSKEKRSIALMSVFASAFLTIFKLIIGLVTGSLGILSEALHSTLDMVAAIVTYIAVRVSDKPADTEHNYGHGKIENLSALIETVLLLITCVWIINEAISRIMSGNTHIEISIWSYIVIVTSILVDYNRAKKLHKIAKETNSQALEADALHFSTDILSSFVVLTGLILSNFNWYLADSIAALGVALVVLGVSYNLGKRAIDVLLDKAPKDSRNIVKNYLDNNIDIMCYHDLKLRSAGADTFIKFDLHLNPRISVSNGHKICDKIEQDLHDIIPRSEIYIHVEPHTEEHIKSENKKDY